MEYLENECQIISKYSIMKKILLSFLTVFISFSLLAQITGGGVQEQTPQKPSPQKPQEDVETGLFPKKISFITVGSFKPELRVENPDNNTIGFNSIKGASSGIKVDFGGYRYFADYVGAPNFNIALYTTFAFAFNSFDWNPVIGPQDPDMTSTPFGFVDYKLGPALSFRIVEGIGAGVYFNIGPVVSYGSRMNSDEFYPDKVSFGVKSGIGINFHLYKFMVGIHRDFGKMKYSYTNDIAVFEPELTLKQTRFSIGIAF